MKTMLILGASSDIGMSYIKHLDENDKKQLRIIAHYRTMSSQLKKVISSTKNIEVIPLQADLSLHEDVMQLISFLHHSSIEPTHILHLPASKFCHMRIKQFNSEIATNEFSLQVLSLANIFKAFLPAMAKKRFGKVVVMLTAYLVGVPPKYVADYIICKYALLGLMKAAAAEYCDKGICINGISPSMIETKFLDKIDSRIVETTIADSPQKRTVAIEEIITTIDFLMSDENSYMCGANLNLTGGCRCCKIVYFPFITIIGAKMNINSGQTVQLHFIKHKKLEAIS